MLFLQDLHSHDYNAKCVVRMVTRVRGRIVNVYAKLCKSYMMMTTFM